MRKKDPRIRKIWRRSKSPRALWRSSWWPQPSWWSCRPWTSSSRHRSFLPWTPSPGGGCCCCCHSCGRRQSLSSAGAHSRWHCGCWRYPWLRLRRSRYGVPFLFSSVSLLFSDGSGCVVVIVIITTLLAFFLSSLSLLGSSSRAGPGACYVSAVWLIRRRHLLCYSFAFIWEREKEVYIYCDNIYPS